MEARYGNGCAGGVHVLTFTARASLGFGLQCQINNPGVAPKD